MLPVRTYSDEFDCYVIFFGDSPHSQHINGSTVASVERTRLDHNAVAPAAHSLTMELDTPLHAPSTLHRYQLHIAHARVLPDPQRILSWEWLRHQVYTINWTNLALVFAVVALTRSIQGTLDSQKSENAQAQAALQKMDADISVARAAVADLERGNELLENYRNITVYAQRLRTAELMIQQLQWQVGNVTSIDQPHLVGDAVSGMGTSFVQPWSAATDGLRPPRFWIDRQTVHLEGHATATDPCTGMCTIFQLPVGYRPLSLEVAGLPPRIFLVYADLPHMILVDAAGYVYADYQSAWSKVFTSTQHTALDNIVLDGISFSVA